MPISENNVRSIPRKLMRRRRCCFFVSQLVGKCSQCASIKIFFKFVLLLAVRALAWLNNCHEELLLSELPHILAKAVQRLGHAFRSLIRNGHVKKNCHNCARVTNPWAPLCFPPGARKTPYQNQHFFKKGVGRKDRANEISFFKKHDMARVTQSVRRASRQCAP